MLQLPIWILAERADALARRCVLIGHIAGGGTTHRLVVGPPHPAPFEKSLPSTNSPYPTLWNHNAKNETCIVCEPDSQLIPGPVLKPKPPRFGTPASRVHLNAEFRTNSQPLCVAFTERKMIDGSSWLDFRFARDSYDYAFEVWGNCTLGLLLHWWHSSRQQSGKNRLSVTSAPSMSTLDLRLLSDAQLDSA